MNNGSCQDIPAGNFTCSCPLPLSGRLCEFDVIDNCDPNPCMNGGVCEDLINDYICQCSSGYTGRNCTSKGFSLSIYVHVWLTCVQLTTLFHILVHYH